MEVDIKIPQTVNVKTVKVFAKVCDRGSYTFYSDKGEVVKELDESYVPSCVFPNTGAGDYLDLDIDLDTGKILNWKEIDPKELRELLSDDEDEYE